MAAASADDVALGTRRRKRNGGANKFNKKSNLPQFSDAAVETEATANSAQCVVLGKDLRGTIRTAAQRRKPSGSGTFTVVVPPGISGQIADELRNLIDDLLKE